MLGIVMLALCAAGASFFYFRFLVWKSGFNSTLGSSLSSFDRHWLLQQADLTRVRMREMHADRALLLVMSGSFSPVHREHIDVWIEAVAAAENYFQMPVLACLICPSHEGYLRYKFGQRAGFIPTADRVEMIKLAVDDARASINEVPGQTSIYAQHDDASGPFPVLAVDWEGKPPDWGRVLDLLMTFFAGPSTFLIRLLTRCKLSVEHVVNDNFDGPIVLEPVFVCGSDVSASIDTSPFAMLVIERPEGTSAGSVQSEPDSQFRFAKASYGGEVLFVKRRIAPQLFSSTKLRTSIAAGDEREAIRITYPSVMKYLNDHQLL